MRNIVMGLAFLMVLTTEGKLDKFSAECQTTTPATRTLELEGGSWFLSDGAEKFQLTMPEDIQDSI